MHLFKFFLISMYRIVKMVLMGEIIESHLILCANRIFIRTKSSNKKKNRFSVIRGARLQDKKYSSR